MYRNPTLCTINVTLNLYTHLAWIQSLGPTQTHNDIVTPSPPLSSPNTPPPFSLPLFSIFFQGLLITMHSFPADRFSNNSLVPDWAIFRISPMKFLSFQSLPIGLIAVDPSLTNFSFFLPYYPCLSFHFHCFFLCFQKTA